MEFIRYISKLLWVVMAVASLAACSQSDTPEKQVTPTAPAPAPAATPAPAETSAPEIVPQFNAQWMIKFTGKLTGVEAGERLEQMSQQFKVQFSLVREMSGDAFVIRVKGAGSEADLQSLLKAVGNDEGVEYVEVDAAMHHQSQSNSPM